MEREFELRFGVWKDIPIRAFMPFTFINRIKVKLWNIVTPFKINWKDEYR